MKMKRIDSFSGKRKIRIIQQGLLVVFFVLCSFFLLGQTTDETLENLAVQIAEKRSIVETLSTELSLTKTHYNEQLRSLATQQADIEIQVKRNELRITQVERELDNYRSIILSSETALKNIEPVASRVLYQLRNYITGSLPFQVDQRLSEIETLIRLLNEGSLDAGNVLARIWNLIESEFRLTSENGLYRQVIQIDGESILAEVARLGMVLMYFKTFDERYGYAVFDGNEWDFKKTSTIDEQRQIDFLFNSLRKNLHEGYFTLPNPYK